MSASTHALDADRGDARAYCGSFKTPVIVVGGVMDDARWNLVDCRNCHAARGAELEAAHR